MSTPTPAAATLAAAVAAAAAEAAAEEEAAAAAEVVLPPARMATPALIATVALVPVAEGPASRPTAVTVREPASEIALSFKLKAVQRIFHGTPKAS